MSFNGCQAVALTHTVSEKHKLLFCSMIAAVSVDSAQ